MVSLNQVDSVAHQPTGFHKLLELIDGGHAVLGRELDDALSVLQSEKAWEYEENVQTRLACGLECAGQGLGVARLNDLELQPPRSGGHLHCFEVGPWCFEVGLPQIEHAQAGGLRYNLLEQLDLPTGRLGTLDGKPGHVSARAGEAHDVALGNRITSRGHDDWDRVGRFHSGLDHGP